MLLEVRKNTLDSKSSVFFVIILKLTPVVCCEFVKCNGGLINTCAFSDT